MDYKQIRFSFIATLEIKKVHIFVNFFFDDKIYKSFFK